MTGRMPPPVARVAAPLLALADRAAPGGVHADADRGLLCEVDWAGPVGLPLSEEREVQAACGVMHVHGRVAGRPTPLAVDYAATAAGVLAAQGLLAVRLARARGLPLTGVRTSVSQAALLAVSQYLAAATVAVADADGGEWEPDEAGETDGLAGAATLTSRDGVRFECETLDPTRWREFWTELGATPGEAGRGWRPFQARYATARCALPGALRATAARASFARVLAAGRAAGVDVLAVREDPTPPLAAPAWRHTPFPHRPRVQAPGVAGPVTAGPLSGLHVVESTRRVQGPLAGHLLRLLGAHVTRVEPPGGDPLRGVPPMAGDCSARFSALNAGKDVVELDLAAPAGRRAALDLAADADVFLHNWAPDRARRWRLDADDLGAAHPALVYAWCSGWGEDFGPRPPLGTDFLVQTGGGLAAAVRPAEEPAAPSLMTLTDVLGGMVCATGVVAALLARARTGHGGRVDSSLYSAASLIPRPPGRPRWTPLDRPVATGDGHLWLGEEARAHPDRLAKVLDLPADADLAALAAGFRGRSTAEWCGRLAEAGLPGTPVLTELRRLAHDRCFARAVTVAAHAAPRSPWEFSSPSRP
ncbi:CoA transferase [Streptomyces sp. 4N509B]|uniref:CoA transferase n=1 Tax=Streptomyces sp. 4N509B TaxID=3457413 RepID=UPI003FD5D966